MIFDTHTHLNDQQFETDYQEVIARAAELGVSRMAIVGCDTASIERSLFFSQEYDHLYSMIGWHPTEAGLYTRQVEETLQNQLNADKVVALGEIGLDYHWMKDPKDVQEKVFRRQIAIAREMQLPISIHTREAMEDTYRILKSEKLPHSGIMHSFSGDVEWAKRFLDLGMYLSISGVVTFKKALDVQAVAEMLPVERLLVETDAPYLSPMPYRGKRNEPGYTRYVVEKIADLRQVEWQTIAQATMQNANQLFGLSADE